MCDANGIWQEDDERVESIAVDYFSSIFKTNGPANASIVVDVVHPVVTIDKNLGLIQDFEEVEVVKALKQMHPKWASKPDGMPPLFYQRHQSLVGNCVTSTILDFLNHGIIPPKFNKTQVVLISKIKNPTKITQFRPISLSNVISRIASQVLTNRLKLLFPNFISENHSAFMSEHLIIDNVLVTFETMHHINQK